MSSKNDVLSLEAGMKRMALDLIAQFDHVQEFIAGFSSGPFDEFLKDISIIDYQKWIALSDK